MKPVKNPAGVFIETGTNPVYRNLKKFLGEEVMSSGATGIYKSLREAWKDECSTLAIGKTKDANRYYNVYSNQLLLPDFYEQLWSECTSREKLLLLDIARDGLYNYKNTQGICNLYLKGLLMYDKEKHLQIMSLSFRNFIICQGESKLTVELEKEAKSTSTWKSIQTPVLILIICIGVFFFVTQENLVNRAGALIPTLTGAVSLAASLFGKRTEKSA
jgi:hypothetical protein